jgi:AraC-like DNA-binding protein
MCQTITAQKKDFVIPDSLRGKSFKELIDSFYKSYKDFDLAEVYAKEILFKAKKQDSKFYIYKGYSFLSNINEENKFKLIYLDSIINGDFKNRDLIFKASAFFVKGNYYDKKYIYKKALDNYYLASKILEEHKSEFLFNDLKHNIGILKTKLGEYEEALELFKECHKFNIAKNIKEKNSYHYLLTLFALSDSYLNNQKIDSAIYINKAGYLYSEKLNDNKMKVYFILNQGAIDYSKLNYEQAISNINTSIEQLKINNDENNLGVAYYYLGISNYKLNKLNLAIINLKKMDSIIQKTNFLLNRERYGYEILISFYKNKEDLKNQLVYTKKLITVDSLLHSQFKDISKNIVLTYDNPKLMKEKEKLIKKLDRDVYKTSVFLYFSIFGLILVLTFFIKRHKQQRLLKIRFNQLLLDVKANDFVNDNKLKNNKINIDLGNEIVELILNQLELFEKKLGFLENGMTQSKLAKSINTNSSYLSKVINHYKNQNFSTYINDLRIEYAIYYLKEDKKIRKFTIKAIANEFGFNNAESFSKAFYRKTGIYPSYFIKQVEHKSN